MTEWLLRGAAVLTGVLLAVGFSRLQRWRALRALALGERRLDELKVLAPVVPVDFEQRIFEAAIVEQTRRETNSKTPYRRDQRIHAVQQRLSRSWGAKVAFAPEMRKRIEAALK